MQHACPNCLLHAYKQIILNINPRVLNPNPDISSIKK